MDAVERFKQIAQEKRFRGWPVVSPIEEGEEIDFFGKVIQYEIETPNGRESRTLFTRNFGWSMCFGITVLSELRPADVFPGLDSGPHVVTLCQWKPGVNKASWELSPGGIGKIESKIPVREIAKKTKGVFLKETGFGGGPFKYLGHIMIETAKYRGICSDDQGFPAHLFLATNLLYSPENRKPNANEIMETILVPLNEFRHILESGYFVEESSVACAYKALIKLGLLVWK